MTLTRNYDPNDRMNSRMTRHLTLTGPASYATGGETVNPTNDFGLSDIHRIDGIVRNAAGLILLLVYDRVNTKLWYYVPNTGAEVANGTDLSGYTGEIVAYGR